MGSIFSLCQEKEKEDHEEVLWLLNNDYRDSPIIIRYRNTDRTTLSTPDIFILNKA